VDHGREGRRQLYVEVARLRRAVGAWRDLGPYLADPDRPPMRPTETVAFIRAVADLRAALPAVENHVGADRPGGLVTALVRQQLIVQTFRSLLRSQRESLSRDWKSGLSVLDKAYKAARQRTRRRPVQHLSRLSAFAEEWLVRRPEWLMLMTAALALAVSLYRTVR
jgi:hypothetical protein